jgi:DNA repair photolyase
MQAELVENRPIISWWKSSDPCRNLDKLQSKLTFLNIINTRNLTKDFIDFCVLNKSRVFLHINISGLNATMFEPKIPTVKEIFEKIKLLKDSGFPEKQILVIINPIIQNDNGIKALKLLVRLFTEFAYLRLKYVRFQLIQYDNTTVKFKNDNLNRRKELCQYQNYLKFSPTFKQQFNTVINQYRGILTIDNCVEPIIGFRELNAFGLINEWTFKDGHKEKLIAYDGYNKFKPLVNLISPAFAFQCKNKCLLCPWK